MDFNSLERKTKAELFELIQSKQAEIDELKVKMQSVLNIACRLKYSSGERVYEEIKEILK